MRRTSVLRSKKRILCQIMRTAIGTKGAASEQPGFRAYAQQKYAEALDEDLIAMIEDLVERQRARANDARGPYLGD